MVSLKLNKTCTGSHKPGAKLFIRFRTDKPQRIDKTNGSDGAQNNVAL